MKKRIGLLVVVVCSFFGMMQGEAKTFNDVRNYNNYFLIANEEKELYKFFNMILDVEDNVYFNISPHASYAPQQVYATYKGLLPIDLLVDFSKILYFGYGYDENITEDYYYATQYLLFERTMKSGSQIRVVDSTKTMEDDRLEEAIMRIRDDIKKHSFSFDETNVQEKKLVIADPYLLENFTVSGQNMNIVVLENQIEVTLLDGTDFVLDFYPKNACSQKNIKLWEEEKKGILLLRMDKLLCEKEYSISIHYEAPIEENGKEDLVFPSEEKPNIESGEVETITISDDEELVQEFYVPNTSKYSLLWLYILIFLGNVYYVFKK